MKMKNFLAEIILGIINKLHLVINKKVLILKLKKISL
jgi:hypothetical protein